MAPVWETSWTCVAVDPLDRGVAHVPPPQIRPRHQPADELLELGPRGLPVPVRGRPATRPARRRRRPFRWRPRVACERAHQLASL